MAIEHEEVGTEVDSGRSADEVLKEDRCAKVPAQIEGDIRAISRINNNVRILEITQTLMS